MSFENGMTYEGKFLFALFWTCLIESICGIFIFKFQNRFFGRKEFQGETKLSNVKFIVGCTLSSCLTLPYVWFVFPLLFQNHFTYMYFSEAFAFFIEALFYRFAFGWRFIYALAFSFFCNFFSWQLGLAWRQFQGGG